MPIWLARMLTVALYLAVMAGLAVVLRIAAPPFNRWMDAALGESVWTAVFAALLAGAAAYGWWPRDATGRMKPLLSRSR
ncbi:hypothetical protein [Methylobacterium organophilum]|uniref:Uncharacterized protein n=1 Tax=Methylobacterium organophilum TaxID=410 RepID=A0ABQ4TF22_METOR|nr:hypothetical protein [Methylobacterium organophilum]GJE29813.1 hypothetical protein LKMONMHP_4699 [Methylobacterium organophilum]